jgi:hypothetical protein
MRLMDLIVQERAARVLADDGCELPGAGRFREAIRDCPLRYVLSDELARCATQLAYAEGDRLSACLDLIHVPARRCGSSGPKVGVERHSKPSQRSQ